MFSRYTLVCGDTNPLTFHRANGATTTNQVARIAVEELQVADSADTSLVMCAEYGFTFLCGCKCLTLTRLPVNADNTCVGRMGRYNI